MLLGVLAILLVVVLIAMVLIAMVAADHRARRDPKTRGRCRTNGFTPHVFYRSPAARPAGLATAVGDRRPAAFGGDRRRSTHLHGCDYGNGEASLAADIASSLRTKSGWTT